MSSTPAAAAFVDVIGLGDGTPHPNPRRENLRISLARDPSPIFRFTAVEVTGEEPAGQDGRLVPGAVRRAVEAIDGQYVMMVRTTCMVEAGTFNAIRAAIRECAGDDESRLPAAVYTDEIWPSPDESGHHAKPHFSLRALRQYDQLGSGALIRRDVLLAVLAEANGTPGGAAAWEWDLHLRVAEWALERGQAILHVPVFGVTHTGARDTSSEFMSAAVRVVQAHLGRYGVDAAVTASNDIPGDPPGLVRVTPTLPEDAELPMVSMVIPTGGGRREIDGVEQMLVERAIDTVTRLTDYPNYEIVVVTSEGTDPSVGDTLRAAAEANGKGDALVMTHAPGTFNFSGSCNTGVSVSRGDYVLLLNDDTQVTDPAWLRTMVGVTLDDSAGRVGAVGPKLLFPDGTVQHGGVHSDVDGNVGHTLFHQPDEPGAQGEHAVDMDVMGVTGACLLVRRAQFEEVGGLSTVLPLNYNDVDLCFKLRALGYTNVYTPRTSLIHWESATRKVRFTDAERSLLAWWLPWSMNDPNIQLFGVR